MSNKIISVYNSGGGYFDHFELLPGGLNVIKSDGELTSIHLKWKKRTLSHLYTDDEKEAPNVNKTQIVVGALEKINSYKYKEKMKTIANSGSKPCGGADCVLLGGRKRRRSRRKSRKKRKSRRKRRKSRKKRKRRTRRRRRR